MEKLTKKRKREREEVSTQVEEKYQSSRISFISIPRSIVVEILARFHSFLPLCRFLFFFHTYRRKFRTENCRRDRSCDD